MHGSNQQVEEPTEKALGFLTFLRHNILFLLILITKSAVQTTPGEPFKHQVRQTHPGIPLTELS